jgi:hypothetical protein
LKERCKVVCRALMKDMGSRSMGSKTLLLKILYLSQKIWRDISTRSGWICLYNWWYIHKTTTIKNGTPAPESPSFWSDSTNHQPVSPSVLKAAGSVCQNREPGQGMPNDFQELPVPRRVKSSLSQSSFSCSFPGFILGLGNLFSKKIKLILRTPYLALRDYCCDYI